MGRKRKVRSLVIVGRRWFAKRYGNTYHSAEMIINGEPAGQTGKHYGYDNAFLQTAFEQLERDALIPLRASYSLGGPKEATWQWAERNGIAFSYTCADVAREKDL